MQILKICNCYDLVDWNANSSHFPQLESLRIWATPKLTEIPYGIGEISTLRYISIYNSMFAAISATSMVMEQQSLGNQDLRLYVSFMSKEETNEFRSMVDEKALTSSSVTLSKPCLQ